MKDAIVFDAMGDASGAKRSHLGKRPHTILIVEDDPELIELYQTVLTTGFDLLIASTCECALRHVHNAKDIDLAILDYRLPDMCGIEVLKKMTQTMPSVPVIVTTGFGDEDIAAESFRSGARDYIKKPFDIDKLQKRIEFYLSPGARGENSFISLPFDEGIPETLSNRETASSANTQKIQKAKQFIDANYASKISRSTVAKHACLSIHHFSRLFKQIIGRTFQDYLKDLRMERAKEELKKDNVKITDAALATGYADLTHFEREFKKFTGLSPSHYRTLAHADLKKAQKAE